MFLPSSTRPDSAIALEEAETEKLKQELEQLRFIEAASRNECEEWKRKHSDQGAEVLRLSGMSAKHSRQMNELQEQCSDAQSSLSDEVKKTTKLRSELSEAQGCIRQAELQLEATDDISYKPQLEASDHSALAELESLRSQLIDLQQQHSKLKQLHAGLNCEEGLRAAAQEVAKAKNLQKAAEEETKGYRCRGEANELMQKQVTSFQTALKESFGCYPFEQAAHKLAEQEAVPANTQHRITELELDLWRAGDRVDELEAELVAAGDKVAELEGELCDEREQVAGLDAELDLAGEKVAELAAELREGGIAANLIINIDPRDRRNWTLLQRAQSAISKASQFDIVGPHDVVTQFLAEMKRLEEDHAYKTSAVARWQKCANDSLDEADSLRLELDSLALCRVAGHRALADELKAKDIQLQMQSGLVAQWQKQWTSVRTYVHEANAEMRGNGMKGI